MQNLVGQTLDDKYSIQKEIGRGGMGAVYYAVHLGTKRPVAVKVIVPQFMRRTEFVERFKREAEAAGRLHHPNVVDVTDFGIAETAEGQVAYLVMEYLEGCTLTKILDEEKFLSLSWTVDILEQVCLAVTEAHRRGIIHRDLKPDNIWLKPNERGGYTVKVLDFGIAKLEISSEEFNAGIIETNHLPNKSEKFYPFSEDNKPTAIFSEDEHPPVKTGYETFIENVENRNNLDEVSIPKPLESLTSLINPATETPFSQLKTLEDARADKLASVSAEGDKKSFYEKTTAEITRVGAIMGTPLYMSPEQCRAERLGTSSDIYSLGVIAYQMLSGRTPFEGENLSVISGHLQFPPPPLKARKVPRKVKKVVHRALSKVPVERPPTAEIFSSQMRSYSENIITIFRRSLVVYIENFSKLIWFSLVLYFPTILFSLATFFVNILKFNGFFSDDLTAKISTVFLSLIKHANIAAGVAAETLITGAVTWIVVQYIDAPLRSFRVSRAFLALLKKWKQFAWIIPLRIVINLFIQGDLTTFSPVTVFLLSSIETFIFWFLPSVVMMENYHGLAALKRGWRLSLKAVSTVITAIIINLVIFLSPEFR